MPRVQKSPPAAVTPRPRLVRRETPRKPVEPVVLVEHTDIEVRAYFLFENEGYVHGRALDHWLRAEQELLKERKPAPVVRRVAGRSRSS